MPHVLKYGSSVLKIRDNLLLVNRLGGGIRFRGGQLISLNPMPVYLRFQPADACSFSCAFFLSNLSTGQVPLLGWTTTNSVGPNLLIVPNTGLVRFMFASDGTTYRNYITLDATFRLGMNYITFSKAAGTLTTGMNVYLNGSTLGGRTVNQSNLQNIAIDYTIESYLQFGKYQTTFLNNVILYDFTFSNAALTGTDNVNYLMSDGRLVPSASFVDKWTFDEKAGTTARSTSGSVAGLSGFNTTPGASNDWTDDNQQPI